MNPEVFITCAVTGAGETVGKSDKVPVTPEAIANEAIAAAEAGAAIAHIHVRDPKTGAGSRETRLYAEVFERVRASKVDVIVNLTAGMGGDVVVGKDDPLAFGRGTDLVNATTRLAHVIELRPEICTLDCGTFNQGQGSTIYISTYDMIEQMARAILAVGVKPELEVFELGHLSHVKKLIASGALSDPALIQLCMGVPGTAPATPEALAAMRSLLPETRTIWSAFGVGASQLPMVALAAAYGGNVRVGLEDNLYLRRGVLATNAQLVERARTIVECMGARVLNPAETRKKLGLASRS